MSEQREGRQASSRPPWSTWARPGREQFFQAVFEQSAIGVAIVDLDGRPVLANAALERFLGFTAAELNRLTYHDITLPEDLAIDAERAAQLAAGEVDHYVVEKRYVRKDDTVVWGKLTVSLLRSATGEPQFVLAMVEDIDERKRAERVHEALRGSEQRYRRVVETAYEGVWTIDASAKTEYVNHRMATMLGFTVDEMLGRSVFDFIDEDMRSQAAANLERRRHGVTELHEFRLRRKDGSPLWALMSTSPILDEDGTFIGALAMVTDITERKRAADALRESEARYRGLVELAPDAILVHCEGLIVFANRAAAHVFGVDSPDALIGSPVIEFVHPDYRHVVAARIQRLGAAGDTAPLIEEELLRRDGTSFHAEIAAVAITYEGRPGVQVVARDITERRRAETAMRELESQLRHAQKMEAVGQLAGGIAHDFNNLLTVINTYSDFLLEELDEASPLRGDVVEIQRAGGRAASLTRQLLAFSRKQILQPGVLDLNDVVKGIEPMLRRLIGDDIRIVMNAASGLGRVEADHGQIEQVLVNIAVNARDAMPNGGRLSIETANVTLDNAYAAQHPAVVPGEYVMLALSDTGSGMDEATRARVFEPFFTTKELGKGTGLGLSTVFGIVKQSGGYVWCYSEPGNGTVFKVYLPRADHVKSRATMPARRSTAATGCEVLLLVEDEDAVRALARRILERHGYTILEARDGADALRIASRHTERIDALVTDIVMPELAGHQVYQTLLQSRPDLRVLYMSGYTEHDILRRGLVQRDTAFLQKPFTASSLARAVRSVLDRREVVTEQFA